MTNKTLPLQEALNIFYARQYAYDILRRFFVEEPAKDYLKVFVQKNMIDMFPFKEESEGIESGIADVKEFLSNHDVVNIDQHYQKLHWDYTRMFIGPFELPAPPWESSYVRKDKLLFQGTTMNVRKYYDKYGIIVSDYNIEADDHIGLELDFMFHMNELCVKIAESNEQQDIRALQQLLKEQQTFLQQHLLRFVSEFTELVEKSAETQFFVGLAKILRHYLFIDDEVLKELMDMEII